MATSWRYHHNVCLRCTSYFTNNTIVFCHAFFSEITHYCQHFIRKESMDENDNLSCQQRSTNLQVRSLNIGLKVRFYCSGLICTFNVRLQFQSHMCTYVCCFQVVENSRFGYCRVKAAPRLRDIIQCKNTAAFTPANTVYSI